MAECNTCFHKEVCSYFKICNYVVRKVMKCYDYIPKADVAEVKQIEIIRDDLKWWLETNTEKGVVYIPKYVLENMIEKMTRTPQKEGAE